MYTGASQEMWIDISKASLREILDLMDREKVDEDHLFAQLRIKWSGNEDDRPVVSYSLFIYGDDSEGKDVAKEIILNQS